MSTHDQFRYDDAAYVLGALSESDRVAFEQHLRDCPQCSAHVRELESIPAALAGISIEMLEGDDGIDSFGGDNVADRLAEPVPDTLLAGLLRRARVERRRRVWTTAIGGSAAAAAIVALTVALVLPTHHSSSAPAPQAMSALTSTPVSATAVVAAKAWGTSISLACRYASVYPSGTAYQLVVIDKSGAPHDAGSWTLEPGNVTHFTGGTWVPRAQIAKIEVEPSNGAPILSLSL